MIEVTPRTVGIWYVTGMLGAQNVDWLCCLYQSEERDDSYKIIYRMRYEGEDESKDVRNWYSGQCGGVTREQAIERVEVLVPVIERTLGGKCDKLFMENGDVDGFFRVWRAKPWVTWRFEANGSPKVDLSKMPTAGSA